MIYPSDVYEAPETVLRYPYRVLPPASREPMRSRNCLRIEHFGPLPRCFLAPRDESGVRSRDCFPYWEMRERFWEDFEYCLGPGCAGCPRLVQHEGRKDPPGRLRARPAVAGWQLERECGGQWQPFEEPYRSLKDIVSTWKIQRGPHRRDERGVYIPLLWAQTLISARRVDGQADQVLREIETTVFEGPPWPFEIR